MDRRYHYVSVRPCPPGLDARCQRHATPLRVGAPHTCSHQPPTPPQPDQTRIAHKPTSRDFCVPRCSGRLFHRVRTAPTAAPCALVAETGPTLRHSSFLVVTESARPVHQHSNLPAQESAVAHISPRFHPLLHLDSLVVSPPICNTRGTAAQIWLTRRSPFPAHV